MRAVLLQLALTSNGRTSAYDSSGGGTPDYVLVDDNGRAKLGPGDAPHLHYARAWDHATDDHQRAIVLKHAQDELAAIRRSCGNRTAGESRDARDTRIIVEATGWAAKDVAVAFRCAVNDVRRARTDAGRDPAFGERPQNGRVLSLPERDAEIRRLADKGLSQQAIATRMNIERGAVRYVLARHKPA